MVHRSTMLSATTAALVSLIFSNVADAFSISQRRPPRSASALFSSPPKKKTKKQSSQVAVDDLEERPAGIGGAEFFGGNKQKEEFYDPVAEARADVRVEDAACDRFRDLGAFADARVASVARSLQARLNHALYEGAAEPRGVSEPLEYAPALKWETPFATSDGDPLEELQAALDFYKAVDVAVVSGTSLGDGKFELNWELSVCWPTFWEPRVLLLGGSVVTVNDQNQITEQVDTLSDSKDLLSSVSSQIWPRFWDMYHIGMTPASEKVQEKVVKKSFDGSYKVVDLPARLLSVPSRLDTGVGREERNAQIVPNHAFSCIIKTMGPKRTKYVTASPLEVSISPNRDQNLVLEFLLPMSVRFQANLELPIPGEDPEAVPGSDPRFRYEFAKERRIATLAYGKGPQDDDVSAKRKELYERVLKDGFKPKLDAAGRPQFTFRNHDVKTCYAAEGGLGMVVYEWRAEFAKTNEIGIELEM